MTAHAFVAKNHYLLKKIRPSHLQKKQELQTYVDYGERLAKPLAHVRRAVWYAVQNETDSRKQQRLT